MEVRNYLTDCCDMVQWPLFLQFVFISLFSFLLCDGGNGAFALP